MTQLKLEVVTPTKILLSTEAEYITIPGINGELGILPSHIPLLTSLGSGVLSYKTQNDTKKLAVHWGYAEVLDEKVTVLADDAEFAESIDLTQVAEDLKAAEAGLMEVFTPDEEDQKKKAQLEQELTKSVTRQMAVK